MLDVKQVGQKDEQGSLAEQGSSRAQKKLQKKKVYGCWKQGQAMWEDYRDAVCRENICVARAQLELKMSYVR